MELPKDIAVELLLLLPVKSVIRFKCVSKGWNSIISDPAFRKSYIGRHGEKAPVGFFYHRRRPEFLEGGPSMPGDGPAKFINTSNVETEELKCLDYLHELGYILASSKGLLLLSRNPMSYHVYDLVSKKYITLPKTLKKYSYVAVGFICREVEQGGSHLSYKVVRIGGNLRELCYNNCKTRRVETYSSDTGKWRKSIMTAASEFCLEPHGTAMVIEGVFHWFEWGGERVVAYSPDDPEGHAKLIELPWNVGVDIYGLRGIGGTQNGCLQFYFIYKTIDIWILKSKQEGGSYLDDDEDVIQRSRLMLAHRISFSELGVVPSFFGLKRGHAFPFPIAISPWDPHIIYLQTMDEIMSYDRVGQKMEVVSLYHIDKYDPIDFVPFQWPVWPCL